jgi:hypothetical protein
VDLTDLSGTKKKEREYLKNTISQLATCSKNKNIRELYQETDEFMKGYRPTN